MRRLIPAALLAVASVSPLRAQDPLRSYSEAFELRLDRTQPELRYDVQVDPADYSAYRVTLTIRNAPDTLNLQLPIWAPGAYRVANFARNVRDLSVQADGGAVRVARDDSSSWRAVVPRGATAVVRYTIRHPGTTAARAANNRSFLRPDGALFDGPQTFVYLDGQKLVPAQVHFTMPAGWHIVTGLVPTADPATFAAPSYDVLIDSPVLAGPALHVWPFDVDGIPHRAAYWALPNAVPFDTVAFAASVKHIVETARDVMGRLPYREYAFLFIDGTGGGLEHLNSTTIGAPSGALAKNPLSRADVTAHEFFHLWNIKRIRPAVLGPFDYQHPVRTTDLWWSEGVTDYFAEEILRRAGYQSEPAARQALATTIESFLGNPAHTRISPERSSWTAWDTPAANGGYSLSYYIQGALLGELLELELRDRTDLRRGMDDVARRLFDRFAGPRGFTGEDLLHVVNEVCGCDLQSFFAAHVSGADELDVDRWLRLIGYRALVVRAPARDSVGRPLPDLRLSASAFGGYGSAGGAAGGAPRLVVGDPSSAWGRAGLLTGDQVRTVNGRRITSDAELRAALAGLRIGDQAIVEVQRDGVGEPVTTRVPVTGYERTTVTVVELPVVTERMRRLRAIWLTGSSVAR
jgi:predicted metalloprotease with PDZ domain